MRFKVGDIVRFMPRSYESYVAERGATAVVCSLGLEFLDVKWLTKYHNQSNGGYYYRDFEHICEANGQLLFNFLYEKV